MLAIVQSLMLWRLRSASISSTNSSISRLFSRQRWLQRLFTDTWWLSNRLITSQDTWEHIQLITYSFWWSYWLMAVSSKCSLRGLYIVSSRGHFRYRTLVIEYPHYVSFIQWRQVTSHMTTIKALFLLLLPGHFILPDLNVIRYFRCQFMVSLRFISNSAGL